MKMYGGVDVCACACVCARAYIYIYIYIYYFNSALVGGKWSPSDSCHFTAGERARSIHWIGGWMAPRAGLDDMEK
jgi:hypothetical protein